jgi:Zn-dependent peptidase ImmA (M78 family)
MSFTPKARDMISAWSVSKSSQSYCDDALAKRFPKLADWEAQRSQPTLKQLEAYARATAAPIGYFFLPEPPVESLPIPDFRTKGDQALTRPSPNLLETVFLCQQRQSWYRENALSTAEPAVGFVGSASLDEPIEQVAQRIRQRLNFDVEARRSCATWEDALRQFIAQADAASVMVMCSGVVLNNNHRPLDVSEFRGFALTDDRAPLVFINGADSKSAQMFTLAHELAHLWLGQPGLSNAEAADATGSAVEQWCNRVAAELLVPLDAFRAALIVGEATAQSLPRLARRFKVSTLVILRRLKDAGVLQGDAFWAAYRAEVGRLATLQQGSSGGGDFYLSQAARVSKRFARALVESTLEGRTLYRDALRMLGISKVETFHELGRSLKFTI